MSVEVSIVMPCLNEAETLATCIKKAQSYLDRSGVICSLSEENLYDC
jgi:glycosyltransferase involved in cell wall biosynthesis